MSDPKPIDTKLQKALHSLGRAIQSNPHNKSREPDKPVPVIINKRPAIPGTSLTIDHGPQLLGDILKQAGQGTPATSIPAFPTFSPVPRQLFCRQI